MNLSYHQTAAGFVVTVQETRIDAACAIEFKEAVRGLISSGHGPLILDLSAVTFLDSSGLGAVVSVMKLLGTERTLELAGLTPNVARVFRLTRMDAIFTIHAQPPQLAVRQAGR